MARKEQRPRIGSISAGTLKASDLIPAFSDELRRIRGALPLEIYKGVRALPSDADGSEDASELVDELIAALNGHALPYTYFGTHPGDGADFGFWPEIDIAREDEDVRKVSDTSEVPADYSGYVLHVNDHGNATLYVSACGGLSEVWAVV